jgi:hypothetical protein
MEHAWEEDRKTALHASHATQPYLSTTRVRQQACWDTLQLVELRLTAVVSECAAEICQVPRTLLIRHKQEPYNGLYVLAAEGSWATQGGWGVIAQRAGTSERICLLGCKHPEALERETSLSFFRSLCGFYLFLVFLGFLISRNSPVETPSCDAVQQYDVAGWHVMPKHVWGSTSCSLRYGTCRVAVADEYAPSGRLAAAPAAR